MDITKAKEFLEKQGLDDCHYQDSGMIEHIAEQMEMYHAEQLRLGGVISRFSVSLVYQNPNANMLRTLVTDANSKEEALGIAIKYFEKETDGFGLILKAVTHLNEG